jgi:hypothetical protein
VKLSALITKIEGTKRYRSLPPVPRLHIADTIVGGRIAK